MWATFWVCFWMGEMVVDDFGDPLAGRSAPVESEPVGLML